MVFEFSPLSGQPGTIVVIQGVHFSPNAEENRVYFNGNAQAEVLESTPNSITTKVPSNAVTGKISVMIDREVSKSREDFIIQ